MRISVWLYLIQQALCTWGLLLALGHALGMQLPLPGAGLLAAASALLCLLAAIHPGWLAPAGLAVLLLLTPRALWPRMPRSMRLRAALTLLLLTLLCTGLGRLLAALAVPLSCIPLALVLLTPLLARMQPASSPPCATVELHLYRRHVQLTALVDSGNLLRDPLTALPVIVISRSAAARLMELPSGNEAVPGLRLISVRTVTGTALMPIFRPTLVRIRCGGPWQTIRAVVGLSPDGYDGFQALVPAALTRTTALATTPLQGGSAL